MVANGEHLLPLLSATSPDVIVTMLRTAFRFRHDGLSAFRAGEWAETLDITEATAQALFAALVAVIGDTLYASVAKRDDIVAAAFAGAFADAQPQLCRLLAKCLAAELPQWRAACVNNQVSPPKLVDFDWRVDVKTSSHLMERMAVPTVFVEMKVQDPPQRAGEVAPQRNVQFELSKQALATMLDGLEKIKGQLAGIQKK
jgi:hypothetical protein